VLASIAWLPPTTGNGVPHFLLLPSPSNSHFFCKEDSSAIKESGNKVSFVSWFFLIEVAGSSNRNKGLTRQQYLSRGQCPPGVKEHMFVFEVVQWNQNSTIAKVQYINQVICQGGGKYQVYKEGNDVQVHIDH
jgi:hypothetical protein